MANWSRLQLRNAILATFQHSGGYTLNYVTRNTLKMHTPELFKKVTTTHIRNEMNRMKMRGIVTIDLNWSRPNTYYYRLTDKGKRFREAVLKQNDPLIIGSRGEHFYIDR